MKDVLGSHIKDLLFHLVHWWIGGRAPKVQRSSCTPRWHCKRRFRFLCNIHWTRIFSISNDSSKNHGHHLQIAGLRWTSSRRGICLHPSKNGRFAENCWETRTQGFTRCHQTQIERKPYVSGAFYLGQFYSGQVRLRPILACPFDHPECHDKKKEKWNKRKRERYERTGQSI